ncbi:hypothetical protein VST63_08490 [Mycolicibacterium sp. 050232]|uniref:hypothetical protein n=1 Tax=Mycolicibacterium sp. 050232 TaxID=3113982 RepID=UPI002E28DF40|nr:hypothetical protein [Mycolicibacterium sp. 050232]MED5812397.1 hypothetical protein [Mycolicibacterium sp. 050232]
MSTRVSRNDWFYAAQPATYLVGPLERVLSPDLLKARLQTIAAEGPHNRLGLRPSRTSRRWEFDPSCDGVVLTSGPAPDMTDPASALLDLLAGGPTIPPATVHVHIAERWLFLNFDHGLGGGRLFSEVIAAAGTEGHGFSAPVPVTTTRNPGLRAFAHTVRKEPTRLVRALDEPLRRSAAVVPTGQLDERESLAYARSRPDFLEAVRANRDEHLSGAPLSALIISAFTEGLHSHGIPPEDEVGLLVDLGRYLPPGAGTLSNFVGIAPIQIAPPYDPAAVAGAINDYTHGCRALIRYGMAYAARLRTRPADLPRWQTNSRRARIIVTDHANSAAGNKVSWAATPGGHHFVRKAPVRYANQISLAINRVASELHLTASYYASTFRPEMIAAVLDRIVAADSPLMRMGQVAAPSSRAGR